MLKKINLLGKESKIRQRNTRISRRKRVTTWAIDVSPLDKDVLLKARRSTVPNTIVLKLKVLSS